MMGGGLREKDETKEWEGKKRRGKKRKRMTSAAGESEGTCFKYLPSEESLILIR